MWLSFDDALPYRPARVLVAGTSGSGKSTLAHHLAATLELRYVELDALHHGANWAPQPAFVEDVTRFAAEPRWATEWQYPAVRELLAQRADLLIFLDLSRPVVMTRVHSPDVVSRAATDRALERKRRAAVTHDRE